MNCLFWPRSFEGCDGGNAFLLRFVQLSISCDDSRCSTKLPQHWDSEVKKSAVDNKRHMKSRQTCLFINVNASTWSINWVPGLWLYNGEDSLLSPLSFPFSLCSPFCSLVHLFLPLLDTTFFVIVSLSHWKTCALFHKVLPSVFSPSGSKRFSAIEMRRASFGRSYVLVVVVVIGVVEAPTPTPLPLLGEAIDVRRGLAHMLPLRLLNQMTQDHCLRMLITWWADMTGDLCAD